MSRSGTVVSGEISNDETSSAALPALAKWFTFSKQGGTADLTPYLKEHSGLILPYELVISPQTPISRLVSWLSNSTTSLHKHLASLLEHITLGHSETPPTTNPDASTPSEARFLRFEAPLALLAATLEFNKHHHHHRHQPLTQLYIAQAPLSLLPAPLLADVPTPALVRGAGRGDVYSSSIWLGLEPTYTPWHRDPNPNLFCQLRGRKAVRMLPPRRGEVLFREAVQRVRPGGGGASPRIRGEEMMHGRERRVLWEAVWGGGGDGDAPPGEMVEAVVEEGDALFIPLGWWHSHRTLSSKVIIINQLHGVSLDSQQTQSSYEKQLATGGIDNVAFPTGRVECVVEIHGDAVEFEYGRMTSEAHIISGGSSGMVASDIDLDTVNPREVGISKTVEFEVGVSGSRIQAPSPLP
ncbi:putative lysine-specific demethylase JMJD5 [Madurella mycetomatis]|uniref:Lysine-specific demethylase JMJD5 n=1 Tax=Madurella mycetomatis TaxID=100816 RepID=A0A175VST3_9PEZI|nr:putative lysine-specific demethylase JMJD5 [Madurella mycetomatis]